MTPLGNDNPRAPETRIVRRPVLDMGASGIGLEGVGVVERDPGWGGVELSELVPEPNSLISIETTSLASLPSVKDCLAILTFGDLPRHGRREWRQKGGE